MNQIRTLGLGFALILSYGEYAVQASTAVACHRALAQAGGFNRYTEGYISFPGYLMQDTGVYLIKLGSKTAEFFPRITADKHLYFLEFAALRKPDIDIMIKLFRKKGSVQVPLDGRVTAHLSRTLRAQVRQLFDDLTAGSAKANSSAALELGIRPLRLSDSETEALWLLRISVEFQLFRPEEIKPDVNAGSSLSVGEIYQHYLNAKQEGRTYIPTPLEFKELVSQLDLSFEASEVFDHTSGLLRQLMVQSEADRPPVTSEALGNALQVCEGVQGDPALTQVAKNYRQALGTL